MHNVKVAFNIFTNVEVVPPGHHHPRCKMVVENNTGYFSRKGCLVEGVNITKTPPNINYSSAVSCETVQASLTISSLNDLDVKVVDIGN